jgi:hypothetical protein
MPWHPFDISPSLFVFRTLSSFALINRNVGKPLPDSRSNTRQSTSRHAIDLHYKQL